MIRLPVLSAFFFIALANSAAASALVSSTFDSDADGWTGLTTDGSSSWSVVNAGLTPAVSSDGVPDGSIVLVDPDGQWTYFNAPNKFLGEIKALLSAVVCNLTADMSFLVQVMPMKQKWYSKVRD